MAARAGPVLVLGADGQLGRVVATRLVAEAEVRPLTRRDLDITDAAAVRDTIAGLKPSAVINCAAFNDVDGAEERHADALATNGVAVGVLARAVEAAGGVLVHYSTDFVFAGTVDRAHTEDDQTDPASVYAQSKLVGEWLAADCARRYVLRVESLFGGSRRPSTIDKIVAALRDGREMRLFADRTVTPSYVDDVTAATGALLARPVPYGLYHCVNTGVTTWLDLGRAVARTLGLDSGPLVPVSVKDVPTRAPRPQYAALSNARLTAAGVAMPTWEDALGRYLRRIGEPAASAS